MNPIDIVISELKQNEAVYNELHSLWKTYEDKCNQLRECYGNADGIGDTETEASHNILLEFMWSQSSLSDDFNDDKLSPYFIDELDRTLCGEHFA